MKRGELVGWGALVGGVTGYFAQKAVETTTGAGAGTVLKAVAPIAFFNDSATGTQANSTAVVTAGRALATAEGAAVGALLGWMFGGKK